MSNESNFRPDKYLDLKEIGYRIRTLRENKGLKQEELGKNSHISLNHIQNIEAGKVNMSIEVLHQLVISLDTTPNYILYNDLSDNGSPIADKLKCIPITKHRSIEKILNGSLELIEN